MGNILFNILRKIRYALIEKGSILENELMWSSLWREASNGIDWIKSEHLMLFPGRWAIGYNTMYVLVRSLNAVKPQNVLELGLGNSTMIISSYFKNVLIDHPMHIVVEHDKKWADFYKRENGIFNCSELLICELKKTKYKKANNIWCYLDFENRIPKNKYNLILIDGPFGADSKYSRIDILSVVPEILGDSFVIIIDDYERIGEKNMVKELEKILYNNCINFRKGIYLGEKECCVIASEEYGFLTSL